MVTVVIIIVNMSVSTGSLMPAKLSTISETVEKGQIKNRRLPKERIPMNKLELIQTLNTTIGLLKSEATKIVSTMNHASFGIRRRVRCLLAG
jgi:hypothetical protein